MCLLLASAIYCRETVSSKIGRKKREEGERRRERCKLLSKSDTLVREFFWFVI